MAELPWNEFKEALKQCNSKLLEIFLTQRQFKFVFNAPSASHAGPVWEKQMRTIRNVLDATFKQCRLDDQHKNPTVDEWAETQN